MWYIVNVRDKCKNMASWCNCERIKPMIALVIIGIVCGVVVLACAVPLITFVIVQTGKFLVELLKGK